MIAQPKNWASVQALPELPKLPAGAYICQILHAAVTQTAAGDAMLALEIDIAEGDYRDYYRTKFDLLTSPNKRWQGALRLLLPCDDGSETDERIKQTLKSMIAAVEASNAGYCCFVDGCFDESTLEGKRIGILFRNEEWDFNGRRGWSARARRALSVDDVRAGRYTIPVDKPLSDRTDAAPAAASTPSTPYDSYTAVEKDDLPF